MSAPVTEQLRHEPPPIHGDGSRYFGLGWPALEWIERNVTAEMSTLETGAGGSTIVFAAAGSDHTAISPAPDEHRRLAEWCEAHDISTERVHFLAEPSHQALMKSWYPQPLDVVLVDGAHGFPYPALDWFLTAAPLGLAAPLPACAPAARVLGAFAAAARAAALAATAAALPAAALLAAPAG